MSKDKRQGAEVSRQRLVSLFEDYKKQSGNTMASAEIMMGVSHGSLSKVKNGLKALSYDLAVSLVNTCFPEVRILWLMGYDDWKTEDEYLADMLEQKGMVAVPKDWGMKE